MTQFVSITSLWRHVNWRIARVNPWKSQWRLPGRSVGRPLRRSAGDVLRIVTVDPLDHVCWLTNQFFPRRRSTYSLYDFGTMSAAYGAMLFMFIYSYVPLKTWILYYYLNLLFNYA